MFSNSKLTKAQKAYLKEMAEFNPQIKFETLGELTIAFSRVGDNVEFATAICADNEIKNKRLIKYVYLNLDFNSFITI